ncbi:MAG: inner membrane protein YpjD [Gammaproteobacteria bacterium]
MTNPLLNFLAAALYLAAAIVIGRELWRGQATAGAKRLALILTLGGVVLHAALLYTNVRAVGGLNLALAGAFASVAWVVAVLYALTSLSRPVENLGVIVLPLTALTVLIEWWWPSAAGTRLSSAPQALHIVISILAYSLLCLAAVQSLMLLAQENQLRNKHTQGFIRALPPMQTMEQIMFQMIGLGFALLTLTLISGVFFSERVFGTPFALTHHIILAALGWAVYAALLIGRWRLGWRGRTAVRWTLGGFALLVLAYFGSKFVLQVVLGR